MNARLHAELWTSWASLLRSYAAAHGLNAAHHAVVEVGAEEITLRVNSAWLRFTPTTMRHSSRSAIPFALTEAGGVSLDSGPEEEMDLAAERLTREMMHNGGTDREEAQ